MAFFAFAAARANASLVETAICETRTKGRDEAEVNYLPRELSNSTSLGPFHTQELQEHPTCVALGRSERCLRSASRQAIGLNHRSRFRGRSQHVPTVQMQHMWVFLRPHVMLEAVDMLALEITWQH